VRKIIAPFRAVGCVMAGKLTIFPQENRTSSSQFYELSNKKAKTNEENPCRQPGRNRITCHADRKENGHPYRCCLL
jgi:hypothetical protein